MTIPSTTRLSALDRPWTVPAAFALLKLLLHLPVLHRYGWHNDELYFVACGRHLSFGYVDHAPLVPWIARLATALFGDSLVGLRIFATLATAAAIFLTGVLARRLGGGPFAQAMACFALLVAPVTLRTGNMFAIPSFEPLYWVGATLILVHIIQEDRPRLWLALGVVVGLGLLNKHSMLFFVFGLAAGVLATPLRRQLRTPWPWLAAAIVAVMFAPNIAWQVMNDWPTASFLRNLNESVMAGISKIQFVIGQFLYLNPLASFVWIWGLIFLFSKAGRPYRVLGIIWLSVFALLLATDSKIYYLSPAYPALIAAGGVAIERSTASRRAWLRPALLALILLGGILLGPAALPYMSIQATDRYMTAVTFGAMKNIHELTGDLHAMFGWPERVATVAEVHDGLPPDQRRQAMLLVGGYGTAGAIDLLGPAYGLPHATSWAYTNWMWADPDASLDTVIAVDLSMRTLDQIFEEVEVVRSVELANVDPSSTPFDVAVCRKPRLTMQKLWPQLRPW